MPYIPFAVFEKYADQWLKIANNTIEQIRAYSTKISGTLILWQEDPNSCRINDFSTLGEDDYPWSETEKKGIDLAIPLYSAIGDGGTIDDRLGYKHYARAISSFIRNEKTEAPLAISIQAPWGAGKTSLMRMIQNEIDPLAVELVTDPSLISDHDDTGHLTRGDIKDLADSLLDKEDLSPFEGETEWKTIWFNPWKYESSDQIWAGLADAIVTQTASRLPMFAREKFLFHLNLRRFDTQKFRNAVHLDIINRGSALILGVTLASLYAICDIVLDFPSASLTTKSWLQFAFADWRWVFSSLLGAAGTAIGLVWSRVLDTKPIDVKAKDFLRIPDYASKLGFRHAAEEDIRRILKTARTTKKAEKEEPNFIIFIDDLDHCSPEKVAAVFEAINLFISSGLPHCYFVIGMDGEVVAAALQQSYKELFDALPSYLQTHSIGWDYLDKFIQIPFAIPPVSDETLLELLSKKEVTVETSGKEDARPETNELAIKDEDTSRLKKWMAQQWSRIGPMATEGATPIQDYRPIFGESGLSEALAKPIERESDAEVDQDLAQVNDKFVLEQFGKLPAWNFNRNPRTLKRCLNQTRMFFLAKYIRANEKKNKTWDDQKDLPDNSAIVRWVYFSFRWPDVVRWVQAGTRGHKINGGPAKDDASAIRQRLRELESISGNQASHDIWTNSLAKLMALPPTKEPEQYFEKYPWLQDNALYSFFEMESQREKKLSDFAGHGLW